VRHQEQWCLVEVHLRRAAPTQAVLQWRARGARARVGASRAPPRPGSTTSTQMRSPAARTVRRPRRRTALLLEGPVRYTRQVITSVGAYRARPAARLRARCRPRAAALRYWPRTGRAPSQRGPTWWGAVVADPRYPTVQEANYARLEAERRSADGDRGTARPGAGAESDAGARNVVVFRPEERRAARPGEHPSERIVWDLVMPTRVGRASADDGPVEEVVTFDDGFWASLRGRQALFGVSDERMLDELSALERGVLVPAGRRWFVVRDEHGLAVAFTRCSCSRAWVRRSRPHAPGRRREVTRPRLEPPCPAEAHDPGPNGRTCSRSRAGRDPPCTSGSGSSA